VVSTILSQRLPATRRSLPEARHATTNALTRTGVSDQRLLASIALAVSEAVGNAVRHAYPQTAGNIDLAVEHHDSEITITIGDHGVGLDNPTSDPGLGMGLQLIGTLATSWSLDSHPTGTTVTMRFAATTEPDSPEHVTDVHGDPETPI
jgi:anti-sigma regulatory factor (Ser/Thr protein kinase)